MYLLEVAKEFISDISDQNASFAFPSLKGVSFDGSENIKTQLAKEMRTNTIQHIRNLYKKYASKSETSIFFNNVDEGESGFEMLSAIKNVLLSRIHHNVLHPDKMKRLFSVSPLRKCRMHHLHFEGKSFFGGLKKKLQLRTTEEIFSNKVCHWNKVFS